MRVYLESRREIFTTHFSAFSVIQQQQQQQQQQLHYLYAVQKLDSLPRKIAGKVVVAEQDKYMNSMSTKNKNLNYYKALRVATKINETKKFSDLIKYRMLTDILLKMDNTEKEKVHIRTLNKCIYLPTF